VNAAEQARTVEIPARHLFKAGAALRAIYGEGEGRVRNGMIRLEIAARSGVVLSE
jgi:hypothetical protein